MNKTLSKAIMQRSKLRNIFLKNKTEENRNNYRKQRNLCAILLNKKFWGVVKPVLSNKLVCNEKITLVEQDNIVENDKKNCNCSQRFFLKHN